MHPEELRSRAKRGLIPGAKTGRRWVFLDADLAVHIRSLYPQQRQALQVASEKGADMSLHRRGGIWWIDVSTPQGERIRRTTGTANKALAQEFHDRIKVELWRIDKLDAKPKRTWNDAVVRWLKEMGHKATANEDVSKLRFLDRYFRDKDLNTIKRTHIDHVTREKLAQGCSNATVNRTLELLRAVLRKCVNEWEWLDRAPFVRMLKEPTRRIRFLTQEEARRGVGNQLRWCAGMRISRPIT